MLFRRKIGGDSLFSQTTEYALRAVAHLATQPDRVGTIPAIAESTSVGAPYLRKVLNLLNQADIVSTRRGAGGGVRLDRPLDELTILDIVNAVDPIVRVQQCPLGLPEHMQLCPLHSELDEAITQVVSVLSRHTVADLLKVGKKADRCKFPHEQCIVELG